jgi:hypothetical protein
MKTSIGNLHIICYKWGPLYGPEYVNRVAAMVRRNLGVPHRFHCITDNPEGLSPEIEIHRKSKSIPCRILASRAYGGN